MRCCSRISHWGNLYVFLSLVFFCQRVVAGGSVRVLLPVPVSLWPCASVVVLYPGWFVCPGCSDSWCCSLGDNFAVSFYGGLARIFNFLGVLFTSVWRPQMLSAWPILFRFGTFLLLLGGIDVRHLRVADLYVWSLRLRCWLFLGTPSPQEFEFWSLFWLRAWPAFLDSRMVLAVCYHALSVV